MAAKQHQRWSDRTMNPKIDFSYHPLPQYIYDFLHELPVPRPHTPDLFYRFVRKFGKTFGNWPSKDLLSVLLERALVKKK